MALHTRARLKEDERRFRLARVMKGANGSC
jgi:hypothetical protein